MDRPIITRAEAKAAGLAHYFTGKPCKHGHVAEKTVHDYSCIECHKRKSAAYRKRNPERERRDQTAWRAANAEKIKKSRAAYRARNQEKIKEWQAAHYAKNREKVKAAAAAYRTENPEKVKAAAAAYRASNPGNGKAAKTAWSRANPDRVATHCRNRRARRKAAEGSHTREDVHRIYEAQKGKCACCKTKVGKKYHVDHVIPLARGGSNFASNLQILCPACNKSKNARDPIEFMQSLGMLL